MFSKEMFRVLIKVIISWQVLAVTVVLILYFSLVSFVARMYRPKQHIGLSFNAKPKKNKAKAVQMPETTSDDDLGLE